VNVRRRVLLTGGTGFVGANLVRRLLADGHAVHLVVRPERSLWRLAGIRDDVKLHQSSLEDRAAVERVVRRARPEWIFHLAAHGAYSWETDLDRILAEVAPPEEPLYKALPDEAWGHSAPTA